MILPLKRQQSLCMQVEVLTGSSHIVSFFLINPAFKFWPRNMQFSSHLWVWDMSVLDIALQIH